MLNGSRGTRLTIERSDSWEVLLPPQVLTIYLAEIGNIECILIARHAAIIVNGRYTPIKRLSYQVFGPGEFVPALSCIVGAIIFHARIRKHFVIGKRHRKSCGECHSRQNRPRQRMDSEGDDGCLGSGNLLGMRRTV